MASVPVLSPSGSGPPPDPAVPTPGTAVLFVAAVAFSFTGVGGLLQLGLGEVGLLVAEWFLLLLPCVLLILSGRFDAVAVLSLRRPSARSVVGSIPLIGGSLWVAWFIAWLQSFLFPTPPAVADGLQQLVTADDPARLAWLILLLCVTPAVCEEALFRGVLLGSTRSLSPARMILLNGVVFGVFHLSLETFVRFLPSAWLGIVIAWTVWRTGSIFIGVLMHFLNNALIVLVASVPGLSEVAAGPDAAPPLWLAPAALACLWAGVTVLAGPRAAGESLFIGNRST